VPEFLRHLGRFLTEYSLRVLGFQLEMHPSGTQEQSRGPGARAGSSGQMFEQVELLLANFTLLRRNPGWDRWFQLGGYNGCRAGTCSW
jgi:hypothetical protein